MKAGFLRRLKEQGFSENIIGAFERVDRKEFVPEKFVEQAYWDEPLPIGAGQTISQPFTVAFMLSLLGVEDGQKILEVGSGSGYVLALLAELNKGGKIIGIERVGELVEKSLEVLSKWENVEVVRRDGSKGLSSEMPFDRILVSAASREIPQNLVHQLRVGGILVAPVRNSIVRVRKETSENKIEEFPGFSFVPLVEDDRD